MLNLKKGQEIEHKSGRRYIVGAIADGAYMLINNIVNTWWTNEEIESNFILPKEKWVPKIIGEEYYYIYVGSNGPSCETSYFNSDLTDSKRLENNLTFQTEAEAQKVVEEIKKILDK